jgi:hypothetical protein
MTAITTHVPQPFEHHIVVPLRKKAQYIRMRDAMASALRPVGTPHPLSATGMPDGVLGGMCNIFSYCLYEAMLIH